MKIEIETLKAEFNGYNARIYQDVSGEEAKLGKVLLWAAGGGFATLTLLGNFAFAGFWAFFMLGCWWFLLRVSGQFYDVHIDKSSGKVHVLSRTGKRETEESFDLSSFAATTLKKVKQTAPRNVESTSTRPPRYVLSLYRPLTDAQIRQEMPEHLAFGLGRSQKSDHLLMETVRKSGIEYVALNRGELADEIALRELSTALINFLEPEFSLKDCDTV